MYAHYKHEFTFENYLDFITDKKLRISYARFRLSSHDLAVERGRYDNTPRTERLCLSLLQPRYDRKRVSFFTCLSLIQRHQKKYLKHYYCRWPTINKFENLMCNK